MSGLEIYDGAIDYNAVLGRWAELVFGGGLGENSRKILGRNENLSENLGENLAQNCQNLGEKSAKNSPQTPQNFGAFLSFVGVVRDENSVSGLSFDIYEPLLKAWFLGWDKKAKSGGGAVFMAHSRGDVGVGGASFVVGVFSPHRRFGLDFLDEFVEDFKKNAPIWKYDLKDGERIWARERSWEIKGAGILGEK